MKIVVVGCGRWGAGLASQMSREGHEVTTVDRDPAAFARLGQGYNGRTVAGPGSDRRVLLEAGIEQADGLAAVTHADETNIVVARLAKLVFGVPKVVARLYDPHKAEVYRRLGLQTIAPVTWGVGRLAELLRFANVETVSSIGSGNVDLVEAEVPRLLVGRTVRELTVAGEIVVAAVSRGEIGRAHV